MLERRRLRGRLGGVKIVLLKNLSRLAWAAVLTAVLFTGCTAANETVETFAENDVEVIADGEVPGGEIPNGEITTGEVPDKDSSDELVSGTDIPETDISALENDYLQPPPIVFMPPEPPVEARGIYVTSNSAGIPDRLANLTETCVASGMNAVVIDVRTENEVTIKNWLDFADEWGVSKNYVPDTGALMAQLTENGIYPIARMVTFLDGYTVDYRPELYIHNPDGTVWMGPVHNGSKRYPWLNPYNHDTWDYVLTYAKAAAELGFKEIQFDYVRFAATERLEDADFGDTAGLSRTEAILAFLRYAVDELKPYNVKVSADVYGTILNSDLDASIVGQDYTELARILDAICPMVYPSHFAGGTYGIAYPDTDPYNIIYQAMLKSEERLSVIPEGEHRAAVRPWLQDFTATYLKPHYLKYGAAEREAQIKAVYDAGLTEWLLWDPGNHYEAEGVLLP